MAWSAKVIGGPEGGVTRRAGNGEAETTTAVPLNAGSLAEMSSTCQSRWRNRTIRPAWSGAGAAVTKPEAPISGMPGTWQCGRSWLAPQPAVSRQAMRQPKAARSDSTSTWTRRNPSEFPRPLGKSEEGRYLSACGPTRPTPLQVRVASQMAAVVHGHPRDRRPHRHRGTCPSASEPARTPPGGPVVHPPARA
jgi:hypothetical protein